MLLQQGSTGDEVKKLQARLGVNNTGTFGPITDKTVKEWQRQNGLAASGIVDDLMWTKLFPLHGFNGGNVKPSDFKFENLRGLIPDGVINQLPETAARFNISNNYRLAHFLAQCGHESGGFKVVEEKLSYSAERLKVVFPGIFEDGLAEIYARNPEKTASRAYANKIGNGDEASRDGYKFRGRGYKQLTGRGNYKKFAGYIREDTELNPDLVSTKYPLASAAFFFGSRNIWDICDGGDNKSIIVQVTKKVNARLLGLQDRINHFNQYFSLLK